MPDSLITVPPHLKVYLGVKPVDMRKSFDGLSAWIHDQLKQNPMAPVLFKKFVAGFAPGVDLRGAMASADCSIEIGNSIGEQ